MDKFKSCTVRVVSISSVKPHFALVVELADTLHLGCSGKSVQVRVLSGAL